MPDDPKSITDLAAELEEAMSATDKPAADAKADKSDEKSLLQDVDAVDETEDEADDEEELSNEEKVIQELEAEEGGKRDSESDEEADEEDEELSVSLSPTAAEINKEFPDLLKKFPQLKETIEKEAAFSEIFASPDEAKLALEKSQTVARLETFLEAGDSRTLLSALYNQSNEIGDRFVNNFLPTIKRANSDLYIKTVAPAITEFLAASINEARRLGGDTGERLLKSAQNLLQYSFNGKVVPYNPVDSEKLLKESSKGPSETETKLLEARYQEVSSRAANVATKVLTKELETSLSKLQSFQNLQPFAKQTLLGNIVSAIDSEAKSDPKFAANMKNLLEAARKSGYSKQYTDQILKTYLNRARSILPRIRNQHVKEAFGLNAKRPEKKKELKATAKAVSTEKRAAPISRDKKPIGNNVKDMTEFLLN